MIETFRITKGYDKIDINNIFEFENAGRTTKGHKYKLKKNRFNNDTAEKYTFSNRIINNSNSLPVYVRNSDLISSFKET